MHPIIDIESIYALNECMSVFDYRAEDLIDAAEDDVDD